MQLDSLPSCITAYKYSTSTSIFSLVDRIKLGVDITLQVILSHGDDLLNGLLKVDILRHVGGRGHMEDHKCRVGRTEDSVFD